MGCVKAWWSLTLIPAHSSLTPVINFHFLSWCVPAMGCTKWTQLLFQASCHCLVTHFFYSHIKNNSGCYDGCDSHFLLFLVEPSSDLYLLFSQSSSGRLPVVSELTSPPGISFSSSTAKVSQGSFECGGGERGDLLLTAWVNFNKQNKKAY